MSTRPTIPFAGDDHARFPVSYRFLRLTHQLYCLRQRHGFLFGRVWGELGSLVGLAGSISADKLNLRLTVSTQYAPCDTATAVELKAAQTGPYAVLTQALATGAATNTLSPSFNAFAPQIPANDVVIQGVQSRLPTLPDKAPHYGNLTYPELRAVLPATARFMLRRVQERQLEAHLAGLRPRVLAELQAQGVAFDHNRSLTIQGVGITLACYQQPSIRLKPELPEWATKLAVAKAQIAILQQQLLLGHRLLQVATPTITVSATVPKKLVSLPANPTALAA